MEFQAQLLHSVTCIYLERNQWSVFVTFFMIKNVIMVSLSVMPLNNFFKFFILFITQNAVKQYVGVLLECCTFLQKAHSTDHTS